MSRSKRVMPFVWLGLFVPVSCLLAGVLAYVMRLPPPVAGGGRLGDALISFAPFWPGTYGVRHIPSLLLGLAVLLLLAVSRRSRKPVVTLFQVRVVLLVLLALVTILVEIFTVLGVQDATTKEAVPLFLYADLDIFLVFLMTFLPAYRRPDAPLL